VSGPTLLAASSGGLSTGQKAGIGVGVPLGVVTLVAAALLFLKWTKRGKTRATNLEGLASSEDDFMSRPSKAQVERVPRVLQPARKPEQQTHPAYEMPNPRLSQPTEMSDNKLHLPQDDEPLYLGIPAHMSGAKRWSKEK
jgi:hypothetical protein